MGTPQDERDRLIDSELAAISAAFDLPTALRIVREAYPQIGGSPSALRQIFEAVGEVWAMEFAERIKLPTVAKWFVDVDAAARSYGREVGGRMFDRLLGGGAFKPVGEWLPAKPYGFYLPPLDPLDYEPSTGLDPLNVPEPLGT